MSVLILSGTLAMNGAVTNKAVTAAACVEMLHAGSLVHDDLLDLASTRLRLGKPVGTTLAKASARSRCSGRWTRTCARC